MKYAHNTSVTKTQYLLNILMSVISLQAVDQLMFCTSFSRASLSWFSCRSLSTSSRASPPLMNS